MGTTNKSNFEKAKILLIKHDVDEQKINELVKHVDESNLKLANKLKFDALRGLLEEKGLLEQFQRNHRRQINADITLVEYFGKKVASLLIQKRDIENEIAKYPTIDIKLIIDKINNDEDLTDYERRIFAENYKRKNTSLIKLQNELDDINSRLDNLGIRINKIK